MRNFKKHLTSFPAVAMTAVSMALTLAVVMMWLGSHMPWGVALVVGLGLDGGWLAALSYERRLAKQGDRSIAVTAIAWAFGLVATGVLVFHALGESESAPWLAVSWLPLAAKSLWLIDGMWQQTTLTDDAQKRIDSVLQNQRDAAAIARAELRAKTRIEKTRLSVVAECGTQVSRAQVRAARKLSAAWSELDAARQGDGSREALTSVAAPAAPVLHQTAAPSWELPMWASIDELRNSNPEMIESITDEQLDAIVRTLRESDDPPLSFREMQTRFRREGYKAGDKRLSAAWKRVGGPSVEPLAM